MKKVATLSLVLVGFVFIVLVLTLVYRQPVAVFAIERILANTSVTLEQVEGLELGWNGIQVKKLALRTDGFQQPIRISGIDIGFSLIDAQLETVTIDHLSIPVYSGADQPQSGETQQTTLENSIRTLHSLPLQDLHIHRVSWEQQETARQLRWQRRGGNQTLVFRHRDFFCTLTLSTTSEPVAELEGRVHLRRGTDDLLVSQFAVKKEVPAYLGTMTLEVLQPGWTEALALLKKRLPGLSQVTSAGNGLTVSLQTRIPDNLDMALWQGLNATITPGADIALVYADANLPLSPLQIQAKLNQPISLAVLNEEELTAELNVPALNVLVSASEGRVTSTLQLAGIQCHQGPSLVCKMNFDWSFPAASQALEALQVASVEADVRGILSVEKEQISAVLDTGRLLRAKNLQLGETGVQELVLSNLSPLHASMDVVTGKFSLTADQLTAKITDAALAEGSLNSEAVFNDLRLTQTDQLTLQTSVSATPVSFAIPKQPLLHFGFAGDIDFRGADLAVEGVLNSDLAKPLMVVKGKHNITEHSGAISLNSTLSFDQGKNALSRHFASWPLKMDIVSGNWTISSQLSWRQAGGGFRLEGELSQTLEALAGYYKDYPFTGLNSTLSARIDGVDRLVSHSPMQVDIGVVDVGVPVTDIGARFSFDTSAPEVHLHQLGARLLGGQLSAVDITHRPAISDTTDAAIAIANVDLGELVRLTTSQDISITGKVSGKLPFVLDADGLSLQQGLLGAVQPGGVLSYHPDAATLQSIAENPATQFAYDVLSNYHYSTLDAEILYQPDGGLVLKNRMYGINPDLNNGQPIKLNPKIEINVLDTLKSLRVSRTVSDFFESQLGK